MSEPKLNIKEESSAKKTRSPPKKARVEQSVPRKKKLKTDADYTEDKGDFEIPTDVPDEDETPDEQDTEPI